MNVLRWLFDVGQCLKIKSKLAIKQSFISNQREDKLSSQILNRLVKNKECLALIWHFHLLANKRVFLIMLLFRLFRVFLKVIMELYLHMVKQELEKPIQCRVVKQLISKGV